MARAHSRASVVLVMPGDSRRSSTAADSLPPQLNAARIGSRLLPQPRWAAILASPLHELTGFSLSVDCLTSGCARERTFAVAELANFYGGAAHVVRRRLWRPGRGDDRADTQQARPATPCAVAGAGGEGVATG